MKKINWRKWALTSAILVLVGFVWPNLTQAWAIVLVNRITFDGNPVFYAYGFLAGALVSVFWGPFWFAVAGGIALAIWLELKTLRACMTLFLVLIVFAFLPGFQIASLGIALGIVFGMVVQALADRLFGWLAA